MARFTPVLAGALLLAGGTAANATVFGLTNVYSGSATSAFQAQVSTAVSGGTARFTFTSNSATDQIWFENDFFSGGSGPFLQEPGSLTESAGVDFALNNSPPNEPDGISGNTGVAWLQHGSFWDAVPPPAQNSIDDGESLIVAYAFTGNQGQLDSLFAHSRIAIHSLHCDAGSGGSCWSTVPLPAAGLLFVPGIGTLALLGWSRRRRERGPEMGGLAVA